MQLRPREFGRFVFDLTDTFGDALNLKSTHRGETMSARYLRQLILLPLVLACGCATTSDPVLYPNEHLQRVGSVHAEQEVEECKALADQYVKDQNKYAEMAKSGAVGGAVGAGTGALAGTITKGSVGRTTAAGAAVGAIVGIVREYSQTRGHSPSYQRFVEHCLHKKGYEVTGWN
ncbi:MAG: hypothetical protein KDD44_01755 [Bdellovibrionales bacterium]|nr:hypothetical protein [Bdellovibrionales bacterium]